MDSLLAVRARLGYALVGVLAFTLCGFGIPGPQGAASGGGTPFDGDLAGSTLTDGTNGYVTLDVPVLVPDGAATAGNLAVGFSGDTDTGWYRYGSGSVALVLNGVAKLTHDPTYQISGPTADGLRIRTQSGQYFYVIEGTTPKLTIYPTSHNVEFYDTGNLILQGVAATKVYLSAPTTGELNVGSTDDAKGGVVNAGTVEVYGSDGTGDYGSITHNGTQTVLTDNGTTFLSGNGTTTSLSGDLASASGALELVPANGQVAYNSALQVAYNATSLTDNTATTLATVSLSSGSALSVVMRVGTYANDGTDFQATTDVVQLSICNKSGTITSNVSILDGGGPLEETAGASTMSRVYSVVDNANNTFTIKSTANSSLTTPTITANYTVEVLGDNHTITLP